MDLDRVKWYGQNHVGNHFFVRSLVALTRQSQMGPGLEYSCHSKQVPAIHRQSAPVRVGLIL